MSRSSTNSRFRQLGQETEGGEVTRECALLVTWEPSCTEAGAKFKSVALVIKCGSRGPSAMNMGLGEKAQRPAVEVGGVAGCATCTSPTDVP